VQDSEHKNAFVSNSKVEAVFAEWVALTPVGKLGSWSAQASVMCEVVKLEREPLDQAIRLKLTVLRDIVPYVLEIETSGEC
jgi:hypothetical protein